LLSAQSANGAIIIPMRRFPPPWTIKEHNNAAGARAVRGRSAPERVLIRIKKNRNIFLATGSCFSARLITINHNSVLDVSNTEDFAMAL